MIILTEFADKVEKILNGVDIAEPRPLDFIFKVATDGFILDHIKDKQSGKNFIPVIVSQISGQYNPIRNIKMSTQTFNVNIFFPIQYKDQFFAFNDYLANQFVGKIINYGAVSGKALTNIDPSTYGEILETDFAQFKKTANGIFNEEIVKDELYMAMNFRVYVTALGAAFLLSNCVTYKLSYEHTEQSIAIKLNDTYGDFPHGVSVIYLRDETKDYYNQQTEVQWYGWKRLDSSAATYPEFVLTDSDIPSFEDQVDIQDGEGTLEAYDLWVEKYYDSYSYQVSYIEEDVTISQFGTGASVTPTGQQLIGDSSAKNLPTNTNYSKSLLLYPKKNDFYLLLLDLYNTNKLNEVDNLVLTKTYEFNDGTTRVYTFNQITLGVNENGQYGNPLTFTLTLGDR